MAQLIPLALASCTYAPLNHEMQSNLRSSNGKYCLLPPLTLKPRGRGEQAAQPSCQCASVCQLELTARPTRNVQLNFEFSVLDFSNCTDMGSHSRSSPGAAQEQHKASRVNEKDTHVNFNFCFPFSLLCCCCCEVCLPQGLLKLVTSWPGGLTLPACLPATPPSSSRCCTAQSVTFFSQLSVFSLFHLPSPASLSFQCPQLCSLWTLKYLHLCLGPRLIGRGTNSSTIHPQIHPRFSNNLPTIVVVIWAHNRPVCPTV